MSVISFCKLKSCRHSFRSSVTFYFILTLRIGRRMLQFVRLTLAEQVVVQLLIYTRWRLPSRPITIISLPHKSTCGNFPALWWSCCPEAGDLLFSPSSSSLFFFFLRRIRDNADELVGRIACGNPFLFFSAHLQTNEELLPNAGKLTATVSLAAELELIDSTRD